MIGNDHRRATLVATFALMVSAYTVACALPVQASPRASRAAAPVPTADPGLSVTLLQDGVESTYVTHAKTVGTFLAERGIVPAPADKLSPATDAALADGARIDYRAAFTVHIIIGGQRRDFVTTARDVGSMLAEQGITLGKSDRVDPSAVAGLEADEVVRITHENMWTALRKVLLPVKVVNRYSSTIPVGTMKTLAAGRAGERDIVTHFVQRDNEPLYAQRVASRVVRQPRARVVVHGIGEYAAFAHLAERGFDATLGLARSALHMIATAYTASCYGCTGYAANGMRAGHGIVAVDPAIIPLGTRVFIPGYGSAIAGDTGGSIIGHRIDLGFNSLFDALRFGRRAVTVYLLR